MWAKLKQAKGHSTKPSPHSDPQDKANQLIHEFQKRSSDTTLNSDQIYQRDKNKNYENGVIHKSINIQSTTDIPFNTTELTEVLSKVRNTAPGEDTIPYEMIKHCPPEFQQIILDLINTSWSEQILPESWKEALMIPIPKPLTDSFRPISLLSCLSKIMEKLVLERLRWALP